MCGRDSGGGDAEHDANGRDGDAIEENPNKEAEGDESAGQEDTEGGSGVKKDEGGADCEGENESPGDLIEGGVDVFESVVAKTKPNDVERDGGDETLAGVEVEG